MPSKTHTTDAKLFIHSVDHTTDAKLSSGPAREHTTDALLRAERSLTHTTDALLNPVYKGTGSLVFSKFCLNGSGLFTGPGTGVLVFGEFQLSGSGTFVPFYRPSKDAFEFKKFELAGSGIFYIPDPFDPRELEQDVNFINRQYLRTFEYWGADTGFGCADAIKPFKCIVVGEEGIYIDPLNIDRPIFVTTEPVAPSVFDLERFKTEVQPPAERIITPASHKHEKDLPRLLESFNISILSVSREKKLVVYGYSR